ncbi:hypothetical protein BIV25_13330 [Streptomyces sp. MUSC 14]|uniref:hypothetical protein n=1 Tax=Streptomyces sp. MUSC 14 TaxID=1354889 RepID=UPI0008F57581|nr:hypothetical protein [Streptomyces sp. MUSC 14]OIJ97784.1 hypothetical protein BIV25_13330 [Streptomyces sp. MUSC 14]
MLDTIAELARRLAGLERRVTALERAARAPYPPWRDLPLTADTEVPDSAQPPQIRATPWNTLEFSGRIGLSGGRAVDEAPVALLPDGFRPAAPRTVPVASDAAQRGLRVDVDAEGRMLLRVQDGGSVKATWVSLDSVSCRIDGDEDNEP